MHMNCTRKSVVIALVFIFVAVLVVSATGCATIINGSNQNVKITSKPKAANVTIDGKMKGQTPYVAKLRRKDSHIIVIEMGGYEPFEMLIEKKLSGWVFGNIVIGGLPGLVVDVLTGAMYKLDPDRVKVTLQEQGIQADFNYDEENEDLIFIAVVMKPDPGWEQIATLSPHRDG